MINSFHFELLRVALLYFCWVGCFIDLKKVINELGIKINLQIQLLPTGRETKLLQ